MNINKGSIKVSGSNLKFTPLTIVDTAVGYSKSFAVPANKEYLIDSIRLVYTATGTAGNRIVQVKIDDGANITSISRCPVAITAGQSRNISFYPGSPKDSAFDSLNGMLLPIAKSLLKTGFRIIVSDGTGVDVGDTASVVILVQQRTV